MFHRRLLISFGSGVHLRPPHAEARSNRLLQASDVIYTADEAAREAPNPGRSSSDSGGATVCLSLFRWDKEGKCGTRPSWRSYRQRSAPLPTSRSDLLTNFAAQAVIAIENARLLNELARISSPPISKPRLPRC